MPPLSALVLVLLDAAARSSLQLWERVGNNASALEVGAGWGTADAAWDSHEIGTMSVVHANGTYHMYYEACAYNGGHPLRALRIGHATSPDGISWVKDAEPVLRNGIAGDWDDEAVWDPFVLYDDSSGRGVFKMWYGGQAAGFVNIQWGYATSTCVRFEWRFKIALYTLQREDNACIVPAAAGAQLQAGARSCVPFF